MLERFLVLIYENDFSSQQPILWFSLYAKLNYETTFPSFLLTFSYTNNSLIFFSDWCCTLCDLWILFFKSKLMKIYKKVNLLVSLPYPHPHFFQITVFVTIVMLISISVLLTKLEWTCIHKPKASKLSVMRPEFPTIFIPNTLQSTNVWPIEGNKLSKTVPGIWIPHAGKPILLLHQELFLVFFSKPEVLMCCWKDDLLSSYWAYTHIPIDNVALFPNLQNSILEVLQGLGDWECSDI